MMPKGIDALGLRMGTLWLAHLLGLPSGWLHRLLHGGAVGRRLRLGRGAVIVGRRVRVGSDVRIGRRADIVAEEIDIADGVEIGDDVTIRCKRLVLGTGSRIDARTRVYGIATANSGLQLGARAWIYTDCHINTDERVTIGAGSAIGGRSLVFTHSSYLPITAGYPVTFAPVIIGSYVWLPWQVFILPGAQIDDGATVGACSLVSGHVPRNSLAVGVPARVVKDESAFRRRYDATQMVELARRVLDEALSNAAGAFRASDLFLPVRRSVERVDPDTWIVTRGEVVTPVVFVHPAQSETRESTPGALVVTAGELIKVPDGVSAIDLVTLEQRLAPGVSAAVGELIVSLSTYGIRFGWVTEETPFPGLAHPPSGS